MEGRSMRSRDLCGLNGVSIGLKLQRGRPHVWMFLLVLVNLTRVELSLWEKSLCCWHAHQGFLLMRGLES